MLTAASASSSRPAAGARSGSCGSCCGPPLAPGPGGRRPFGVSVKRTLITPEDVADFRRAVKHVMTWPVDTVAELDQARRLGVNGVIGKDLTLLGGVLAQR